MPAVEAKVKASSSAAAVSGLVLWVLGKYVFKGSTVPDVIVSWVYVLVPAVVAFAAGYFAKHTPRPDLAPPAAPAAPAGITILPPASGS